jgi:carotenoid cleavage dioxygenase
MLHAVYFNKRSVEEWYISYMNKYVVSETFELESKKNEVTFIPAAEGQPYAMLVAFAFNMVSITDPYNT